MNSALSQSDLSNVMLWQTLSFTCQTVLEIRGEKHLVNHSGCIYITEEKSNAGLEYSDSVSSQENGGGWNLHKLILYILKNTWAYHISYV